MRKMTFWLLFISFIASGCREEAPENFTASVIVEGTAVRVSALLGGQIERMLVDEGAEVAAGDTLAVLDAEKLTYQLEQVEANLANLTVQEKIAAVNLERVRDEYTYANTRFERIRGLFEKSSASQQAFDDAKLNADRAAASRETTRQQLAAIAQQRKALLAQEKLLHRQLQDAILRSPIAGQITTKYYEPGETVPTFGPVFEIIDLNRMWTKVYVTEPWLPRVQIGQEARVEVDGFDNTLTGTVAWISPKAEFTPKNILTAESRTALVYAVKVVIDNPDHILKHGMPVTVVLQPQT